MPCAATARLFINAGHQVLPTLVAIVIVSSEIQCIGAGWIPVIDSQTSSAPLATPSEDPRLQEGLRQILQLDERLMQKSAAAAMVARETFPDAWLAADRKQAEKDQKLLLASLDRCSHLAMLCSCTGKRNISSFA